MARELKPAAGLGERLAEIRGATTRDDFATQLGVAKNTIGFYERGEREPTASLLGKIAEIYQADLNWLVRGEGLRSEATVPRYDLALAAGHGSFVERALLLDYIPFTEAFVRRKLGRASTKGLVMLDARGDSMEPTIEDGDLVMVDTLDTQIQDGLMAFVLDDVAFIKRMRPLVEGGVEIISDNRDVYEPQRLAGDRLRELQVIGRIRWIGKVV